MKKWYKYDLIWKKGDRVSGFLNSNKQFLRNHEQLLIFYKKQPTYNIQFDLNGKPLHGKGTKYLTKNGINIKKPTKKTPDEIVYDIIKNMITCYLDTIQNW